MFSMMVSPDIARFYMCVFLCLKQLCEHIQYGVNHIDIRYFTMFAAWIYYHPLILDTTYALTIIP